MNCNCFYFLSFFLNAVHTRMFFVGLYILNLNFFHMSPRYPRWKHSVQVWTPVGLKSMLDYGFGCLLLWCMIASKLKAWHRVRFWWRSTLAAGVLYYLPQAMDFSLLTAWIWTRSSENISIAQRFFSKNEPPGSPFQTSIKMLLFWEAFSWPICT